jgi:protein-S-isoprenylcysteine O-methyltransferase Ste14
MSFLRLSPQARRLLARALVTIQFGLLFALGALAIAHAGASKHEYLVAELSSIVLGAIIIASAGYSLRPSLRISPIPKPDSPLIDSGIYKRVRHPMYLGVILIGFGLSGFSDSLFAWLLEIALIANLSIKARFEDALLLELHPESLHYQMHVSRILPCLGASCKTSCTVNLSKN